MIFSIIEQPYSLVLCVPVGGARLLDLLPVLHPEALLVGAMGRAQVALQGDGGAVGVRGEGGAF